MKKAIAFTALAALIALRVKTGDSPSLAAASASMALALVFAGALIGVMKESLDEAFS